MKINTVRITQQKRNVGLVGLNNSEDEELASRESNPTKSLGMLGYPNSSDIDLFLVTEKNLIL